MRFSIKPIAADLQRIAARFMPSEEAMSRQSLFMVEQIKDRLETQGASGGESWPPRVLPGSKEPLLGGLGGSVDQSLIARHEGSDRAVAASTHPGAKIFQRGTVGKGGSEPTIRPKVAKALFIPLTQKAKDAYQAAPHGVRSPYGAVRFEKPQWVSSLKKGKMEKGQLVPPDADYLLLAKTDHAPRPLLPTSTPERAAQVAHWLAMTRPTN